MHHSRRRLAVFLRQVFFLGLCLGLAACAASSERNLSHSGSERSLDPLAREASLAVAVAGDGKYIDKVYPGSGAMARSAMASALARHTDSVSEVSSFVSDDSLGQDGLGQVADYVVCIKLLHWEDRATEWSGLPDRIEVELRLLDGATGEILERRQITAKSSWFTLGGDHPQDLLVQPFNDYAASLFGAPIPAKEG